MSARHWIDARHYCVASKDGSTTYVYQDRGLWRRPVCVEVIEHVGGGSRIVYEPPGAYDAIFNGGRGRRKTATALRTA